MTMTIITKKANDASVAARIAAASVLVAKTKEPIHVVRIGNLANDDNSGYLGLIMNVNKNGKAIRISLRDGTQRVHVLKDEVENLVKALVELKANGVATSQDDVEYDKVA